MENVFTKSELVEMWKRPVERQYMIAQAKIMQAISETKGDLSISFSGGKDSSLLLDMYCEVVKFTDYADKPIRVVFADTTNETSAMYKHIKFFISYVEDKYGVNIDFIKTRPANGLTWARFIRENGIPLISKEQSKAVRAIKTDMKRLHVDYQTVLKLAKPEINCVKELQDIGFSKTGVLSLTGFVYKRQTFGKRFILSNKWLPMVNCPVDLTEQCCYNVKESPLLSLPYKNQMTGEQAQESSSREAHYLKTGCNFRYANGSYHSKPFGAMTSDGVLYAIKYRGVPICSDYGDIIYTDGHYKCSKQQRTGCALCGFGCQYDTQRFVRLQETEPAKVKFAFKSRENGGAGYGDAIEYMNEYCGTEVQIPQI